MKTKRLWGYLLLLCSVFAFVACGDDNNDVNPKKEGMTKAQIEKAMDDLNLSLQAVDIHTNAVDFVVYMRGGDNVNPADYEGYGLGICYCKASKGEPTINDSKVDLRSAGFFQGQEVVSVENLEKEVEYNFRIYVSYKDVVKYYSLNKQTPGTSLNNGNGDDPDHPQNGSRPEACYLQVKELTSTSIAISLKGYVNNGTFPTDIGLLYSTTNQLPTKENCDFVKSFYREVAAGEGETTVQLNNLKPGTTYYVRAYWVLNGRTQYFGNILNDDESYLLQDAYAITTLP